MGASGSLDRNSLYPLSLFSAWALLAIWSAIEPAMPDVWIAEMLPVFGIAGLLALTYSRFQFSHTAYTLMSIWLVLHTIGAHYTFANVPFDWFSDLVGSERNHFDRFAHFSIGFYAFAMAEWVLRKKLCELPLALCFALFFA